MNCKINKTMLSFFTCPDWLFVSQISIKRHFNRNTFIKGITGRKGHQQCQRHHFSFFTIYCWQPITASLRKMQYLSLARDVVKPSEFTQKQNNMHIMGQWSLHTVKWNTPLKSSSAYLYYDTKARGKKLKFLRGLQSGLKLPHNYHKGFNVFFLNTYSFNWSSRVQFRILYRGI